MSLSPKKRKKKTPLQLCLCVCVVVDRLVLSHIYFFNHVIQSVHKWHPCVLNICNKIEHLTLPPMFCQVYYVCWARVCEFHIVNGILTHIFIKKHFLVKFQFPSSIPGLCPLSIHFRGELVRNIFKTNRILKVFYS